MAENREDANREGGPGAAAFPSVCSIIEMLLITFSVPYIHRFSVLRTDTGYKYGVLGFCSPEGCTYQLGYDAGPELPVWLTKALVVFPLAGLMVSLGLVGMARTKQIPASDSIWFRLPTILGAILALFGLVFAACLQIIASSRFSTQGIEVSQGPVFVFGILGCGFAFASGGFGGPPYPYSTRYIRGAIRNAVFRYREIRNRLRRLAD